MPCKTSIIINVDVKMIRHLRLNRRQLMLNQIIPCRLQK